MSDFIKFRDAVNRKIAQMQKTKVFRSAVDVNELWDTYLASFPEGTNPLFRERTEHDCSCCKQFIRAIGNMLIIQHDRLESVWDIKVGGTYQIVADALAAKAKEAGIESIWVYDQQKVGLISNHEKLADGTIHTWDHFYAKVESQNCKNNRDLGYYTGQARTNYNLLKRSLEELSPDSVELVLELIQQNSLYRGQEHKQTLITLRKLQAEYQKADNKELFLWDISTELKQASGIRNTVIGTLLTDISEGMELNKAVNRFTDKVAPHNYKRPSSVITPTMVKNAEQKVRELGLEDSLQRRYATIDDITINNVLFADRSVKEQLGGVFDQLAQESQTKLPNLDKIEEVFIETFLSDIVPDATSIEVLFENKHQPNLVSLIAPTNADAPNILKWGNNFSWSYIGEVTDSIKERVKAAGGNIEADVRISLSWFNYDDLDLSVIEPSGYEIYYGNRSRKSPSGGTLDVDMNASSGQTREPVENIVYPTISSMKEGEYTVVVHNFSKRETQYVGFELELEMLGQLNHIPYAKDVRNHQTIEVVKFNYSKANGITFHSGNSVTPLAKEHWGIQTQSFHKVQCLLYSPNHWDGEQTGNKHVFFMLEGCKNPESSRGLYNEFLRNELNEHRKVFEVLGGKLKTPESDEQLSGLGFSTTQQNELICRVTGSFTRVIRVVF